MYALIQDWQIKGYTEETQVEWYDCIYVPEVIQSPKLEDWQIVEWYEISNQEIGDKILQDVFEGNPYAQLADLTKSQVITLALLVPILGKDTVKSAYSDLITTLEKVSQARVENWLSPFDLSFLE